MTAILLSFAQFSKLRWYEFFVHILLIAGVVSTYPIDDNYAPSSWYTKYDSYHEYCSTPEQMNKRRVPPLQEDNPDLGETRLVHAAVVVRHGARTPWAGPPTLQCWDGYWDDPENRWDCSLTTILAPPNPNRVREEARW